MKSIFLCRMASSLMVMLLLVTASLAQHIILPAQLNDQQTSQTVTLRLEPAAPAPIKTDSAKPASTSTVLQTAPEAQHRNFFAHILRDQKTIWTSPLRIKQSDAKWLLPLAATTAILIATDKGANKKFSKREEVLEVSSQISRLGEGYTTFAFAGLAYSLGRFTRNERLQETVKSGLEALINTSIAVGG